MNIVNYIANASVTTSGDEPVGNDVVVLTGAAASTIVKSIKIATVDACVATVKYKSSSGAELFSYKVNLDDNGYVLIDSFDVINAGETLVFNADQASCKLKADVVEN